jgi:pyruvate/2-oxoglutarate dehydrogenase complex dihydrolipoamide dehydrogenase (E3) component
LKVSSRLADSLRAELSALNVDLHEGYGELVGDRTIRVLDASGSKITLTADNVIVATGSRPVFQRLPGGGRSCLGHR